MATRSRRWPALLALVLLSLGVVLPGASDGQVLDPYYAGSYTLSDLGSVPGVPPLYGGLVFDKDDPNVLLIGGNANDAPGALYSIGVVRDGNNHVVGFSGSAAYRAEAPYNDGGIVYGPDGVLFLAQWPVNMLGQLKPGSSVTDKTIDMTPLGVTSSLSALNFVPAGFPGAGSVKLVTWEIGDWYDADIVPDGSGTFDLANIDYRTTVPGGPEGFVFIPTASPLFGTPAMLISAYSEGRIDAYDLDGNGDPIVGSRRLFVGGLSGAEGAVLDPLTGDFLFSTFGGGDRIVVVQGFARPGDMVPEPGLAAMLIAGLASAVVALRRHRA